MAIKPITRFEKHLSWRARGFGNRMHDRGCSDCFAHGGNVSVGAALSTDDEHVAAFLMADAYVIFGPLDGIGGSVVRAGVGPFAGLRVRLPGNTVGLVTGTLSYLPAQDARATFDLRAVLRTRLATNVAMGLEGAAQPRAFELQLGSYLYF